MAKVRPFFYEMGGYYIMEVALFFRFGHYYFVYVNGGGVFINMVLVFCFRHQAASLYVSCIFLWRDQELKLEFQLGPSLACPPKAPTSECLLPSFLHLDHTLSMKRNPTV